jgi:Fe-S cluster assembly protein SufD
MRTEIVLEQEGYPMLEAPPEEYLADPKLPEFWREARREALQAFARLPFPSHKDERWRFTDLKKLDLRPYRAAKSSDPETLLALRKQCEARGEGPARLVLAGEEVLYYRPGHAASQEEAVFLPLAEAARKYPDRVRPMFFREKTNLGGEKFAALAQVWCRNGVFLSVPDRACLAEPVEVEIFFPGEAAAIFPYILIEVGSCASAQVRIRLRGSAPVRSGFSCLLQDQFVHPGGELRTMVLQDWPLGIVSFQLGSTVVYRDGFAATLHVNLGGRYARLENRSKLTGPGARSHMLSLTVSQDEQEFDQRTFQEHAADHTTSDLLYKNALADRSRTIFAGMIDVDPLAQGTDAYQSNRNLLLSDQAEANTLPGLEIMANEVRCTHGATVGPLDPEELFYLQQRGLPLETAKRLLVRGFLEEVLLRFGDAGVTEEVLALVEEKLGGEAPGKSAG